MTDREGVDAGAAGPGSDFFGTDEEPAAPLPSDVRDALVQLARALQKHGLYPPGHPALRAPSEELRSAVLEATADRGELSLGVAPDRIVWQDAESSPERDLFRGLAERLHEPDLTRVTFRPGVTVEEISDFLSAVRDPPSETGERLGDRQALRKRWDRIDVRTLRYEQLGISARSVRERGADGAPAADEGGGELWGGLVRAAMKDDEGLLDDLDAGSADWQAYAPEKVAEAVERLSSEAAYSETVARQLFRMADELAPAGAGPGEGNGSAEAREPDPVLRERFQKLVDALSGPPLRNILRLGATPRQRQAFLLASAQWLPVKTTVALVEAAAEEGELSSSHWMLRLLAKFSTHLDEADAAIPETESALKEQVREMIADWEPETATTGEFARVLRQVSEKQTGGIPNIGDDGGPGAERVLKMAVELDVLGQPGERAWSRMTTEERPTRVLEILSGAPAESEVAEELWSRLGGPDMARRALEEEPPDFDTLSRLAERYGARIADPLLDVLVASDSRSVRGKLYAMLADMDDDLVPRLTARLHDSRWFVQRNMLALMAEVSETPPAEAARRFLDHDHPVVRREAYRILLDTYEHLDAALSAALEEDDTRSVTLALSAAGRASQPALAKIVPALRRRVADEELPAAARVAGVRALARSGTKEAHRALLDVCRGDRGLVFWKTDVAEKSPVVLEALALLAHRWRDEPETRKLLDAAASSSDPEVRAAAAGRRPGDAEPGEPT
ncbi:MAG: hypothetical protein ACOC83_03080 [Gemmatimonadota bacterium]